ncbi:MAG TPA: LytTR family transcriptional regulator DNA-binding domain-containing protein [Bacteroidales bacterium]|nr:LytTR family transcriptional regulator DNA-binding domain-containing protein [Bacteroidales bacterium]HOX73093.1 LytTR family transcriptional regulator DNA-binding domain-containing protein [Bacteroidales bacterium]HPM86405.1 LytTR family transcriptional regulator DNA-binding domain-containing protein [Bacteroidales bacterium]
MDIQKPIAPYLVEKGNIVRLIIFTALFALVFINIYSPFGADKWFNLTKLQFFTYSSIVILTGVLVVVISRIIMYHVCKKRTINLIHFLVWIGAEILFMASFYALFQKFVLKDSRIFTDLVKISARNTALVLLLPYSISWLYLSWRDKKEKIDRMEEITSISGSPKEMIPFFDDKSVLKFSVKKENLLYLESTENYINICYLNNGKISRYMLRDTMKKMEEKFAGTEIIRCHRSYMVNFDKVKVIRKEKDGLKLDFDNPQITDIPVSRTYVDNVMETFSKYSRL